MRKTLIGVLASRDSVSRNDSLGRLLETLHARHGRLPCWHDFAFAFSGGTYERVVAGADENVRPVNDETWDWLHNTCGVLQLPEGKKHGGGILLGSLVARGTIQLLWPFFSPATSHWLHPENLALLRLADLLSVSTFMNAGSVLEWASVSAELAVDRHPVSWPPTITLEGTGAVIPIEEIAVCRRMRTGSIYKVAAPPESAERTWDHDLFDGGAPAVIALIAHDQKKDAMKAFVSEYEPKLRNHFSRILCTGTTGQLVMDAAPSLAPLVHRYRSGPMGGDLEIATEVLFGTCHVVVFFTDPLRPHPHADDIRSVFGACMRQDHVRMFSNERQTRRWFDERFGV
ncbi:methylglyoxal synthase [Candidatus Bipolaricaulota bacterium]|nr:methylglyoxal synthase [Candidatus Bipolaricaulota bacterium]